MCDLLTADSALAEVALVSLEPGVVRLDLTVASTVGPWSYALAHINLTPAQALILTYQLNEARTAALQPVEEPS